LFLIETAIKIINETEGFKVGSEFYLAYKAEHEEILKQLEIKLEKLKTSQPGDESLKAMHELYEYMIEATHKANETVEYLKLQ